MKPHGSLCRVLWPRRPESVLAAMEHLISWEALRLLSWEAPGETDSHLWQDPEQETMLFVHRLLRAVQNVFQEGRPERHSELGESVLPKRQFRGYEKGNLGKVRRCLTLSEPLEGKFFLDAGHASHSAQQASLSPQFHGRFRRITQ